MIIALHKCYLSYHFHSNRHVPVTGTVNVAHTVTVTLPLLLWLPLSCYDIYLPALSTYHCYRLKMMKSLTQNYFIFQHIWSTTRCLFFWQVCMLPLTAFITMNEVSHHTLWRMNWIFVQKRSTRWCYPIYLRSTSDFTTPYNMSCYNNTTIHHNTALAWPHTQTVLLHVLVMSKSQRRMLLYLEYMDLCCICLNVARWIVQRWEFD